MNKVKEKLNKAKEFVLHKFRRKGKKDKKGDEAPVTAIEGVEIISTEKEGEGQKKKMKHWKKALIIAGCTIAVLALGIFITIKVMIHTGRESLYANATSEKPNISLEKPSQDENGSVIHEIEIGEDGEIDQYTQGAGENESGSVIKSEDGVNIVFNNGQGEEKEIVIAKDEDYDLTYGGVKYKYNDKMITFLIMGIDKSGKAVPTSNHQLGGQSDAMFLLTLNPDTKVMKLIVIPRDSIALVDLYNPDGSYWQTGYTQICLQHAYGDGMDMSNERAKKSVSRLFFDLPIHSATSIYLDAIPSLNDAVGGITLKALHTFEGYGHKFTEGQKVTLDGAGAYAYTRYRDTSRHYTAEERLARQKQYLSEFINQALAKIKKSPGTAVDVYNIIKKYVVTDLGVDEMAYLASEVSGYSFGGMITLSGWVDTSRKYERFYLDEGYLMDLVVKEFYKKVY